MKKIISILLVMLACSSCSTEQQPTTDNEPICTYKVRLTADVQDFNAGTTRASDDYQWEDMARIYLHFHIGNEVVAGVAVYSLGTGEWIVTTSQSLPTEIDGDCEAYFFVNATTSPNGQTINLSPQSTVYQDIEGSFVLTEDNMMAVRLMLTPRTGRVRFKGKPSTAFAITGLTSLTSYNITTNTFSTSNAKLTGHMDATGNTDYCYVFFTNADKRQLTMDATGKGAYLRTFDEEVLVAGQSGYITLPNMDDMGNWKLVNVDNQQEITLPTVSATEVSNLRSRFATLNATVSDVGNGTLSETGFVYSTNSNPTVGNGTKATKGKSARIEIRISDLTAETTYHVRAYAQNERGIAYGGATSFTTLSAEEDGTLFGKDGYGEDEDLNSDSGSSGAIGKEGYGKDEDLNSTNSSSGTIGKGSYSGDADLNSTSSSGGTFNKDGYNDDENRN